LRTANGSRVLWPLARHGTTKRSRGAASLGAGKLTTGEADATGRTVLAGPVEATALGNVAMQALATGAVASLADARAIIERSFPAERFDPIAPERWDAPYRRFLDYVELTCA